MFKFSSLFQYWEIPLISLVAWYGMLIAMLACWSFQGHPIYWFMDGWQFPVYISDIGATNLQPLFISCAGFQGIFFWLSLVLEKYLRHKQKLLPCLTKHEWRLSWCAIVFAAISMLGILFCSIFKTSKWSTPHICMVGVFIVFAFFLSLCNTAEYFLLYKTYRNEMVWGVNRFLISAIVKVIWMCLAIVFAVLFGYFMHDGNESVSAAFEWTLSFWYGILLCVFAFDLSPIRHDYDFRINQKELPPHEEDGSHMSTVNEDPVLVV